MAALARQAVRSWARPLCRVSCAWLALGALALVLTGCATQLQPTPTPTRTPHPSKPAVRGTPRAGAAVHGWRGTIHRALSDPTCDDYFLRDADGQAYGIAGETAAISQQLDELLDTSVSVIITGTLYAHVDDMRGLCVMVQEMRRADEVPAARDLDPTSTATPSPRPRPGVAVLPLVESGAGTVAPLQPNASATAVPTPSLPSSTPAPTVDLSTPTPVPETPMPTPPLVEPSPVPPPVGAWRVEIYANDTLSGSPALVRDEPGPTLERDWGGDSAAAGLPVDRFSVRWTGSFGFNVADYRFLVRADDGVRVTFDGRLIVDDWDSRQAELVTGDVRNDRPGAHVVTVEYRDIDGPASISLRWSQLGYYPDWRGEYYAGTTPMSEPILVRNDPEVNFDWGTAAPHAALPSDQFFVRWTRGVSLLPGTYRFWARADDGVRIWLDTQLVADYWYDGVKELSTVVPGIQAGPHMIRVDYYEGFDRAQVRVWWEHLNASVQ